MLAVLLAIISISTRQTVSTILTNSACLTCMSKKQMLQGLVTIMGSQLLGLNFTEADITDRVKCLECASQKQLMAAILYSFCGLLDESETQ